MHEKGPNDGLLCWENTVVDKRGNNIFVTPLSANSSVLKVVE